MSIRDFGVQRRGLRFQQLMWHLDNTIRRIKLSAVVIMLLLPTIKYITHTHGSGSDDVWRGQQTDWRNEEGGERKERLAEGISQGNSENIEIHKKTSTAKFL